MKAQHSAGVVVVLCLMLSIPISAAPVPNVEVLSSTKSGSATHVLLRITNWQEFPVEELRSPPALPPNPCAMVNAPERMWLEVFRADRGRSSCMPVTRKVMESFSFRDYDGKKPQIYIVLTDIKTGVMSRSKAVATDRK